MNSPSSRMLALLALLQMPREWPGQELAERLEVTTRTVRRDVDRLRELGYFIHAAQGTAGYRLAAGSAMPPLIFEDDEVVAIAVALRMVESMDGGDDDVAVRALTKMENILPPRLARRVHMLGRSIDTVRKAGPPTDTEMITTIAESIQRNERVRFDYTDASGADSVRDVEPYQLVHAGWRWYLMAWDPAAQDWRTFRSDRLRLRTPGGPRFTPREAPDFVGKVTSGMSVEAYACQGQALVTGRPEKIRDQVRDSYARIEPGPEGRCRVIMGGHTWDRVTAGIIALGREFSVLGPPEWVAHMCETAQRVTDSVADVN